MTKLVAGAWCAIASVVLLTVPASAAEKSIPILLLDGQSGGPYHAWQLTTKVLKTELEETGLFQVTVATSPQFGGDFSDFKPRFSDYKAIVWNYDAPDWPADLRQQLEEYVRNGGGLVIVHAADNAFPDWPAWNQMIGIGGWRNRSEKSGPLWYFKDGKMVSDTSAGSAGSHGARIPFQVVTRDAEHPIMKGLPSAWMHAADELYATLRGPGQNMTVLATAHSDPGNKGTDHDEPMLMVLSYGKGRIFHTTMGHDVAALSCVGFMTTYQRGTEWAATGKVTQTVPATFPSANTVSFRVDIAKMDPAFLTNAPTAAPPPTTPPPQRPAAEQDHQRMMDLLHITTLRRGVDGDPKSPYAANYDESKVSPNPTLSDPLLLKNGKKVTTAKTWWDERRPEIVEDFDREIYGRVPKNTPKVNWEVVSTTKEMNGDVPVITKKLIGHLDNSAFPLVTVGIDLTLTTPANAGGPVPVMMEFGLSPEVLAMLLKRYPEMMKPGLGPTWQHQVLAKGWGYAVYIPTSIQADNGEGLTAGVIGLVNQGQPRGLDDWGALRAWAWGASRALDYFETDKSVDAKQVGVEGHSRYGKAALVAMANDQRFAIAYISSSGEAGAKLFRRNFGEQIGNIAGTGEYHWMAGNFIKYAGPLTENDLPVDAHELIALCAPRPVFIGAGAVDGDGWVDAKGMFLAAVGAGPVYKLLGKKDLGTTEFPPIETALIDGDVAFRQHSAGHTPAPNWPTFLTFASRYLNAPPLPAKSKE